jgi:hypothetical protein
MNALTRWLAPSALAVGLGLAALFPAPARASDDLVRLIVDVADVIYHGGNPYYRHGNYGRYDRVIVVRDPRGHRRYYRDVPRNYHYRSGPPYGVAHGYYRNGPGKHGHKCNKHGKCRATYYDPRHDRDRYDRRYRDDRRYRGRDGRRYGDDRRWRARYDD